MKNRIENRIVCIGEALIDWTCLCRTLDINKAENFIKTPGGAPANVAVGLAKLGYPISFAGGFSDDIWGEWLKQHLSSYGIGLDLSVIIENSNTRNAYVFTDENGDRVFKGFSKSCCADSMLEFETLDSKYIIDSSIIYFGSLIQASEITNKTVEKLIELSGNTSAIRVYDPNLRLYVWKNADEAIKTIKKTLKNVDIVKLSDDEINLITGVENDIEKAADKLFQEFNLKLIVVTLGKNGSYYRTKQAEGYIRSFEVESVEMTGAGDGFVAGLLGGIYDYIIKNGCKELENIDKKEIEDILIHSNAIGAIATTKPGAMSALPDRETLESFLQNKV